MAIQPIDLSVMYAQSANVSKMAGNVQAAQLAESIMQQTTVVQQNLENSKRRTTKNRRAVWPSLFVSFFGFSRTLFGHKRAGPLTAL